MSGRIVGIFLLVAAAVAGAALYYLQVYGFYEEVAPGGAADVQLLQLDGDTPVPIRHEDFRAIDSASSPIRFRGCFTTSEDPEALGATFQKIDEAIPRKAPSWFDCFDAEAIAGYLEAGSARAFLGEKNIHFGVDRLIVVHEDGRGWIWHELNDCGERAYDGTVVGEECPPRPEDTN